ncbi:hypothetical protein VUJ46_08850 [Chryseobacterium sp. MYb264]|uniref:hypothetical protein n=1 Tax=Chryseobacterium sp. MYb264 TaxID=2745153 RepID=UPI002E13F3E4|nr:hypothetical protein VUJ46_08850 [Chryseobacterium sp. MYb264]
MKKRILLLSLMIISSASYAQIGINNTDPKSTFDITAKTTTGSTPEGLLIPRVDRLKAQTMTGVVTSTLIYVSTVATGSMTGTAVNIDYEGYYFFDGRLWQKLGSSPISSPGFAIGEIKSSRIVIDAASFSANSGSRIMMTGKSAGNTSTISRQAAYELASAADKSKYIIINGLRMDFIKSWRPTAVASVSPKLFNTTSGTINYNTSALSTADKNIAGMNTTIAPNAYSYQIDGNDDFTTDLNEGEYVNAMITFSDGQWYNCTWHATRDSNNYYFYMTAQRLN